MQRQYDFRSGNCFTDLVTVSQTMHIGGNFFTHIILKFILAIFNFCDKVTTN